MSKDLKTLVAKELEKGSTPLMFDSVIVPPEGFREIDSRERLLNVLQYLLRVKEHRKLIWNDTLSANNVYMDVFLGKTDFHRAALITRREEIYQHINWYGGKLKPDYNGKTVIETDVCAFFNVSTCICLGHLENSPLRFSGLLYNLKKTTTPGDVIVLYEV